jgi:molecular chaperone DnaK (HSP70)
MTSILDCLDQYSSGSSSDDEIDNYFDGDKDDSDSDELQDDKVNNNEESNEIVVGIDLGTSNSCISVWRNNNLEIIPVNSIGDRTLPSIVSFTNRSRYVGKEAKKQIDLNPENTIYEIKRLIGRKYDDEVIKQDEEFITYGVDKDDKDNVVIKTTVSKWKTTYTPEEISSIILMELKMIAEDYLLNGKQQRMLLRLLVWNVVGL